MRRHPLPRALGFPAGAALVLGCLTASSRPAPQAAPDLSGEAGLRVWFEGDSVHVAWIPGRPGPGFIEVTGDGVEPVRVETAGDSLHHAAFHGGSGGQVALHYGSPEDPMDRHRTLLDLDVGVRRPGVTFPAADSLFVVGDVHGEFDTLAAVLTAAGVVDDELRWRAGRAQLAFAGDLMDRGAQATRTLWFVHRLEREATEAGGRVHVVLGNHEIMVMTGDLRYVSAPEARLARLHGVDYAHLFHPERSYLGRWLTSKPAMIRTGDVLIAHGGVSTDQLGYTLESFDDTLAAWTHDAAFRVWADTSVALPLDSASFAARIRFFSDSTSVLWFRGYARTDTLGPALDSVLDHFDARLHVVGHTPGPDVREAYGGALTLTNTLPFARQLLLLTREDGGWARYRIDTEGRAVRLGRAP